MYIYIYVYIYLYIHYHQASHGMPFTTHAASQLQRAPNRPYRGDGRSAPAATPAPSDALPPGGRML